MWATVLVVLFGLVPQIGIGIIGLLRGDLPADGVLGTSAGYPLFQPPFWLLWIPALLMLASSIVSIREEKPSGFVLWPARWELSILSFVGATITGSAAVSYGAPQLMIVLWATVPWLLAIAVFAIRGGYSMIREIWELWGPRAK